MTTGKSCKEDISPNNNHKRLKKNSIRKEKDSVFSDISKTIIDSVNLLRISVEDEIYKKSQLSKLYLDY